MKNSLCVALSLVTIPLMASYQGGPPTFQDGFLTMATRGGFCGGVTLVPKADRAVRVISQRFVEGWFHSRKKPKNILSKWVELPVGGVRVGYDWAGFRPSHHYRIYCQTMNEHGAWQNVQCSEVLELMDVQHNRPCVAGPVGPSARYGPLHMKTKSKIIKH